VNSTQLLAAQRKGAEILHNGAPVSYSPRWPRDMKPWISHGFSATTRYPARACQAYFPEGESA
jgi:hypothetical protein